MNTLLAILLFLLGQVSGSVCPEAQTEVWTARGLVPIEEIRDGDLVIATDETTGHTMLRPVTRTFTRLGAPIVAVTLLVGASGQDGAAEAFNTTEEHPFYVEGRGWVEAQSLKAGDVVQTMASGVAPKSSPEACLMTEVGTIEFTSRLATVHNFEVEGVHTYRVGTSGVLVHNGIPCMRDFTRGNFHHNMEVLLPKHAGDHAHHMIPHRYQTVMPYNLNDPTKNGAWVPGGVHIAEITARWNRWHNALGRNPSMSEVLEFAARIEVDFGSVMRKP